VKLPGVSSSECCLLEVDAEVPEVAQKKLSSGSGEAAMASCVGRRLLVLVLVLELLLPKEFFNCELTHNNDIP